MPLSSSHSCCVCGLCGRMTGNYHRMRVFGRSKYLRPLEQSIGAGDAAAAVRQWESFGGLDRMVDECTVAAEGPQIRVNVANGSPTVSRGSLGPCQALIPFEDILRNMFQEALEIFKSTEVPPVCQMALL